MTQRKLFKQFVRARMEKTGESYASARRHVLRQTPQCDSRPAIPWHFPGNIPAATALRVFLAQAGVRAPHTGQPFSEALVFGIAGGIGAGVFSFLYEKGDFASFFVAGRHSWQDDVAYLKGACQRLNIKPVIHETAGIKGAEKQLRETLASFGCCIAWVDLAHLPHRAAPAEMSGGGYHVVAVYGVDDAQGAAWIGDLADHPIPIPLADLATARARIKKHKNRLLAFPPSSSPADLGSLVWAGLRQCHDGLLGKGLKSTLKNFQLEAFRVWAKRMHGGSDRESWERVFTRGPRLWRGLTSINDFIENYGTGGGLCRPLFADFLSEASDALGDNSLRALADRYAEIGRGWSALADAALPGRVPTMREAKELQALRSELMHAGGNVEDIRATWKRLGDLGREVREQFPLAEPECAELRAGLQQRIMALYEAEVAAHAAIGAAIT